MTPTTDAASAAPAARAPVGVRGRRAKMVAAIVVALVVLAAVGVWFVMFRSERGLEPGAEVEVVVPPKSTSAGIAQILASRGVVPNALGFRIQARLSGGDIRMKPGTYAMRTGMGFALALAALDKGPDTLYFTLAIPEGWTIDQIAARVEARTGAPAKEFVRLAKTQAQDPDLLAKYSFLRQNPTPSLEGYLFPKTYRVKAGSTARQVLELMLTQFGSEVGEIDVSVPSSRGLNGHQIVTMASMIEREARVPSERPVIASVIYNRLARGMLLEIDATVLYVLGNKTKLLWRDLRVDSPYNTYIAHGLPPGPIASPGLASLRAVCRPADTGYYFYVRTGKDGSHTFTATKAEFLAAKEQAKKGLK